MALTYAQKFSFCETIESLLFLHLELLKTSGLAADAKMAALDVVASEARTLDAKQESIKAVLVKATEDAVKAMNKAYVEASSTTDAMVGVLGKDTALAKRLRKLREEMNRQDKGGNDDDKKT